MNRYILIDKCAKMPATCRGKYRRIAIVELDQAYLVTSRLAGWPDPDLRIDSRDKRIKNIVHVWDRLHVGSTDRCEYARTLATARAMLDELNGTP